MFKIYKYILFIDEVAELYFNEKKQHEDNFFVLCEELNQIYYTTIKSLSKTYISPFLKQYPFLGTPSFLQVVNKDRKETYHSLFLKYILNNQCKIGGAVLSDFCNIIGCQTEWLKSIEQKSYIIENEYSTKWQKKSSLSLRRFDLLIRDDANKCLIVIENKIDSKVRTEKGNQLDVYREFCEREFSHYSKWYVLLSYRNNCEDAQNYKWKYIDYHTIFKLLLKYVDEDAIVKDYLKTLYSLLFPNIQISNMQTSLYCCWLFINRVILKLN